MSDCCSTSGVTCDGTIRVTQIDWNSTGLDGTLNRNYIPLKVTILNLEVNSLTGAIPSQLPSGLVQLYLYGNLMSGNLPLFPANIQRLVFRYPGWPGNHFTGSVLLNTPTHVYINDNWISDLLVQDNSTMTGCDISNTPLLGNPNIVNLVLCAKVGLYDVKSLPCLKLLYGCHA